MPSSSWPSRASRCSSGFTSIRAISPPARLRAWKGGIVKAAARRAAVWHDLTDEFGMRWSMPDDRRSTWTSRSIRWPRRRSRTSGIIPGRKATTRAGSPGCASGRCDFEKETPYAVVSGISGVVYEICWYLRGLEQWFCDLMTQAGVLRGDARPDAQVLDGLVPPVPRRGRRRGGRDHDRRRPRGPERAAVQPRAFTAAWSNRATSASFSTSGPARRRRSGITPAASCTDFIPDLIDNGVDILNPVQISARNMDPANLKRRFGRDWCSGAAACDAQHVLPRGTPAEVAANVRRNLRRSCPAAATSSTTSTTSRAKCRRKTSSPLFDTAYEYGAYS